MKARTMKEIKLEGMMLGSEYQKILDRKLKQRTVMNFYYIKALGFVLTKILNQRHAIKQRKVEIENGLVS